LLNYKDTGQCKIGLK